MRNSALRITSPARRSLVTGLGIACLVGLAGLTHTAQADTGRLPVAVAEAAVATEGAQPGNTWGD
ncbi:hypothetical protein ABZ490_28740 [Streptomyces sp. NPDC005811]|uniref:hypothetical protein n=1 Tax=Streptomyces sp. NPDC005811 TaxID=3154565 RepID=UPI0033F6615A